MRQFSDSIPDYHGQLVVWQLGKSHAQGLIIIHQMRLMPVTVGILNLYNVSRGILEMVFVGRIVNIRNECLFFWVHSP